MPPITPSTYDATAAPVTALVPVAVTSASTVGVPVRSAYLPVLATVASAATLASAYDLTPVEVTGLVLPSVGVPSNVRLS